MHLDGDASILLVSLLNIIFIMNAIKDNLIKYSRSDVENKLLLLLFLCFMMVIMMGRMMMLIVVQIKYSINIFNGIFFSYHIRAYRNYTLHILFKNWEHCTV